MDIYDKMNNKIINKENIIIKGIKENNNIPQNINNDIIQQKYLNNYIFAHINIGQNDVNKDIRIINSFEEYIKENPIKNNIEDIEIEKYKNEKEIKENCKLQIQNITIKFSYFYKFKNKGIYTIKYIFNNKMKNINHLFSDCKNIEYIDFSNMNTKNII